MRIASLCGSSGPVSSNQAALTVAAEWIRTSGVAEPMTTVALDGIPTVPSGTRRRPAPTRRRDATAGGGRRRRDDRRTRVRGWTGRQHQERARLARRVGVDLPPAHRRAECRNERWGLRDRTARANTQLAGSTRRGNARHQCAAHQDERRRHGSSIRRPSRRSNSGRVRWSTPPLSARGICWRSSAESSGRSASTSGGSAISDSQVTRAATAEPMRSTKLSA